MASITRPPVYRVAAVQAGVLFPLCALVSLFNITAAYSALLGGLMCLIPNAYFASYAFRYMGARAARHIARAFYRGETGKFLLTIVGFALVFTLVKPLDLIALFLAYLAMLALQWFVAARVIGQKAVEKL